jgi:hypothetical protein
MKLHNVEVSGIVRVCYTETGDVWNRQYQNDTLVWKRETAHEDFPMEVSHETMIAWIKRACKPGGHRRVWIHGDTVNIATNLVRTAQRVTTHDAIVAWIDAEIATRIADNSRLRRFRKRLQMASIIDWAENPMEE